MKNKPSEDVIGKIRKLCEDHPSEVVQAILETHFWPEGIETSIGYCRFDDGTEKGKITVSFSQQGDCWAKVVSHKDPDDPFASSNRFRNFHGGGGQSERVHVALKILAVAIKMDNEENPQDRG